MTLRIYRTMKTIKTNKEALNIGLLITDKNPLTLEGYFILSAPEVAQNIFNTYREEKSIYKIAEKFIENWNPIFAEYFQKEGIELEEQLITLENDFCQDLLKEYFKQIEDE
jgi:hypothetical protein